MWLTLLAVMLPPPSAETLAEYAVSAPIFPAEAVQYNLANGETIGIVPEPLRERTVMVTVHGTCGMWCNCPRQWQEPRKIADNKRTPLPAIESILRLAGVTRDDVVFDLGSGDGRVCILAAKQFDCFAVGLDKRPEAVKLAEDNAKLNGVDALCAFYAFPIRGQRLAHATVVYCYLEPSTLSQVVKQLPDNVRVAISYQHPWPGGRGEKIGEFYVWRREALTAAKTTIVRRPIRLCSS